MIEPVSNNISEDFSFNFKNDITISQTRDVLKRYYDGFENAFSLKTDHPIFFDTNILLNYYGMSKADKTALKAFFVDKIQQIHITEQIEKEFQRNRITAISDYFDELNKIKNNYKQDLQEGIKNKFNNILQSKIVQKDFPDIRVAIENIYNELESKLFKNEELKGNVNDKIDATLEEHKNLIYLDPILDIYANFQRIPNLEEGEIAFLQKAYEGNLEIYKKCKDTIRDKNAFPGCGEKKEKDPYGDYIIFHEILKFMKTNKKDVIFLTRDVTKSDWLQKTKEPFVHYIEKAYQLTGQILYIFDATDLLNMISFENIYQVESVIVEEEEDDEDDDGISSYYKEKFSKLVDSIRDFLENEISENYSIIRVGERNIENHDIDLIVESPSKKKEGILVYDCGSSKKGYKKSIQRRINACNHLVKDNICDTSTLIISLKRKSFNHQFNYQQINSENPVKIIVGFIDNLSEGKFVQIKSIMI